MNIYLDKIYRYPAASSHRDMYSDMTPAGWYSCQYRYYRDLQTVDTRLCL